MDTFPMAATWPPFHSLSRVMLAIALGLFVGLEREWRGKEAGLRTFAFVALLGALGGMLGPNFAIVAMALLGVLVAIINWQALRVEQGAELTTSTALLVVGFSGVLCGFGHRVTPTAVAVVSAGLLAWKERLSGFSHRLTAEELRSAILLAMLAFAIYPILPAEPVDPWQLIVPRAAMVTVITIAAIGFANYVLWKLAGPRVGMELTGLLGGLVNSTVTVTELAARVREAPAALSDVGYRGIILATIAMSLRNALVLGVFALPALVQAAPALGLMLLAALLAILVPPRRNGDASDETPILPLVSPFSLSSALRYGGFFLLLEVTSEFGQRALGDIGFYGVTALGGLVSSASAVASAATLAAHGRIPLDVAAAGAIVASLASAAVDLVIVARVARVRALTVRVALATVAVVAFGVIGAFVGRGG